jgi:hypothetical protein
MNEYRVQWASGNSGGPPPESALVTKRFCCTKCNGSGCIMCDFTGSVWLPYRTFRENTISKQELVHRFIDGHRRERRI